MKATKQAKELNIAGIMIKVPEKAYSPENTDKHCPFTGTVRLHGRNFIGIVVSKDTHKSATVEMISKTFIQKYERFKPSRTRLRVHNPWCINAAVGDSVRVFETRPLSKTKHFIIVENLGLQKEFLHKMQRIEADEARSEKHKKKKEVEEEP